MTTRPTLVFVHWNEGVWFDDVLAVANSRCQCPIVVVSDRRENKGCCQWLDIQNFNAWKYRKQLEDARGAFFSGSIFRWFVLRNLLSAGAVSFPVFTPDWDDLILQPLAPTASEFANFHYATTSHCGIKRSPLLLNSYSPLLAFCDFIESILESHSPRQTSIQDSSGWSVMAAAHDWKVANLSEINNNSVFDHSIGFGAEDGYIMHAGMKKIDWFDHQAYFYVQPGRGVIANSIQCWGQYKSLIPSFAKSLGLK